MKKPTAPTPLVIGILALQGSFAEHVVMCERLGKKTKLIRSLADTKGVTACILPGGESTVMMKLLKSTRLDQWLITAAKKGMPLYGTCAGLIVLANLGLLDVQIDRNAYGPQLYSFEDEVTLSFPSSRESIPGIFIRAPRITLTGPRVKTLAIHGRDPVLVQQKNILASSFHPELTDNTSIHHYFCGI